MSGTVVLLHGVWMPGAEMLFVKRHLETEYAFDCHLFSYPSVRGSLDENAEQLADLVASLDKPDVHLVGHSLGGIVALRMLHLNRDASVGRVVCLGSPLNGSAAAEAVLQHRFGQVILGNSLPTATISEPASEWAAGLAAERDIGIIAGRHAAGVGGLFADFEEANDGTVAVRETRLASAADHIVLDVSHTGMVISKEVCDQVAAFLRRGRFLRND